MRQITLIETPEELFRCSAPVRCTTSTLPVISGELHFLPDGKLRFVSDNAILSETITQAQMLEEMGRQLGVAVVFNTTDLMNPQ